MTTNIETTEQTTSTPPGSHWENGCLMSDDGKRWFDGTLWVDVVQKKPAPAPSIALAPAESNDQRMVIAHGIRFGWSLGIGFALATLTIYGVALLVLLPIVLFIIASR